MAWDREHVACGSHQYHVTALCTVPDEAEPCYRPDEIVSGQDWQSGHYAGTSTTSNSEEDGVGSPCSRMLAK